MWEQFLEQLLDSSPILQFLGVMLVAVIPFIEGYFAVPAGIAIGFSPVLTIVAAIVGNWLSVMVVILASDQVKKWLLVLCQEFGQVKRRNFLI